MSQQIPRCLEHRYKAFNDLMQDLTGVLSKEKFRIACCPQVSDQDPSMTLMCQFWGILKEQPGLNLSKIIQEDIVGGYDPSKPTKYNYFSTPQQCYTMCECSRCVLRAKNGSNSSCSKESTPSPKKCAPLSKTLVEIKEVSNKNNTCNEKIEILISAEEILRTQIAKLEEREQESIKSMKNAEDLWTNLEASYKKKLADSAERQKSMAKQLSEVETNANKWRKNLKDLEFEMSKIDRCEKDVTEKINQKTHDLKMVEKEIEDLKNRVEIIKQDSQATEDMLSVKNEQSRKQIEEINKEMAKLETNVKEELKIKAQKEEIGTCSIRNARATCTKAKALLVENNSLYNKLLSEKDLLVGEIDLLKNDHQRCKGYCSDQEKILDEELACLEKQISIGIGRCTKCHQCSDTGDIHRCCTDCPKCSTLKKCNYKSGYCEKIDDCVCNIVKKEFLGNVFDNMYSVLMQQSKTPLGKSLAQSVLESLSKSRNGKLDDGCKKMVQVFVIKSIKKNLILTVESGAIKTKCEMEPKLYEQLVECLGYLNITPPQKTDKTVECKKEPCCRWGNKNNTCYCPKGPNNCICGKSRYNCSTNPSQTGCYKKVIEYEANSTCNKHNTRKNDENICSENPSAKNLNPSKNNTKTVQVATNLDYYAGRDRWKKKAVKPKTIHQQIEQMLCSCYNAPCNCEYPNANDDIITGRIKKEVPLNKNTKKKSLVDRSTVTDNTEDIYTVNGKLLKESAKHKTQINDNVSKLIENQIYMYTDEDNLLGECNTLYEASQRESFVSDSNNCTECAKYRILTIKGQSLKDNEIRSVLKSTQTGDFDLIFDKEFENYYRQELYNFLGIEEKSSSSKLHMPLSKTSSDNFTLNFDKKDSIVSLILRKTNDNNISIGFAEKITDSNVPLSDKTVENKTQVLTNEQTIARFEYEGFNINKTHNISSTSSTNLQFIENTLNLSHEKSLTRLIDLNTTDTVVWSSTNSGSDKSDTKKNSNILSITPSGTMCIIINKEQTKKRRDIKFKKTFKSPKVRDGNNLHGLNEKSHFRKFHTECFENENDHFL